MWLIVTIVVFLIARQIAIKINSPLANPLLISIAVLIPLLTYLNVPFETYYADNEGISFLLQPAVVALAYLCTSNSSNQSQLANHHVCLYARKCYVNGNHNPHRRCI